MIRQDIIDHSTYNKLDNEFSVESVSKYISSGVACYAILILDKFNLIEDLKKNGYIEKKSLKRIKAPSLVIEKALSELIMNGILNFQNETYHLSDFGQKLLRYLGLIYYIYFGYTEVFVEVLKAKTLPCEAEKLNTKIYDEAVVLGSDHLAESFINPFIVRKILDLDIQKNMTVCDLGCGDASRLNLICKICKLKGIGIDASKIALKIARNKFAKNTDIALVESDITKLNHEYPKVELLMQTMVFHDFTPDSFCIEVLKDYKKIFPNMKYFIFCDIVAPSNNFCSQLPGFDLIHAFLNIKTRTYDEIMNIFQKAGYKILSESLIPELPNMIVWVLAG